MSDGELVREAGDRRVDAALERLGELAGAPVSRHVEIFEDVHQRLQELLASADTQEDEAPVPGPRPGGWS
ncbi:hypothetical protein [Spirillospora sp. CA-294931]|uniref:hypothetical protein n=1 Tax=Spirillospora sp. CA-294931 TaxID=3240042 RepID=UPI003D8C0B3B